MDNEYKILDDSTAGSLKISNDVIATVAKLAALEIEGVAEVAHFPLGVKGFISKSANLSPVKVDVDGNTVHVDISIIVEMGSKIPSLSAAVQKNIKDSINETVGLDVTGVDIMVAGIVEPKKAEETVASND